MPAPSTLLPRPRAKGGGMQDLLRDKVVLVSGGTQGVGGGIARAAAREGATVVVTGRRREQGEALAEDLHATGAEASYLQCDVADLQQVSQTVDTVVATHGRIDCLV